MESSEQDFKRYLNIIYKKRYVFLISAASIITLSVALSFILPKSYEAKSTVFIERNVINSLVKDIAVTPSIEARLKVLSYAMQSRNILLKVLDTLGVDEKRAGGKDGVEKLITELQRNTTIKMKDMDLFVVSYADRDPKFASGYINTLVRLYVEENTSSKREEAYGANRFLAEQIKFFKEKLDSIETDVINFRKEKGIFVSTSESKIVDEIKAAQDEIESIKINRRELEARRETMKRQLSEEKPYTVAVYGRDSLNERLSSLQKKQSELLVQYTRDYPEVIRVQSEIESLKELIKNRAAGSQDSDTEVSTLNPLYQQLREESIKIERDAAAMKVREEHLKNLFASKKEYLRNIPAEKTRLSELEMERNTYRGIYEELVAKLGQSEVSKQMELQDKTATFRIVDPAIVPNKPVSPNRVRIILLGILAGLGGAAGVVFVQDRLDASVKGLELLKTFGLPVLAMVPYIEDNAETERTRKKDIISYSAAGVFMLCVIGVIVRELFI